MKKLLSMVLLSALMLTACSDDKTDEKNTILDVVGSPSTEEIDGYTISTQIDGQTLYFKSKEDMDLYRDYLREQEQLLEEQKQALEEEESRIYKDSPEVGLWHLQYGNHSENESWIREYNDDGTFSTYGLYDGGDGKYLVTKPTDNNSKWRTAEDDEKYEVTEQTIDGKYIRTYYEYGEEYSRHEVYENENGETLLDYYAKGNLIHSYIKIYYDDQPNEIKRAIDENS